jgi:uncharacterized Zn-binding protein involved in type VI secretion
MALDDILALLRASAAEGGDGDEETSGSIRLALTYPAGRSPKVFTSGWVFGARCFDGDKDISDTVKWSGSGVFNPDQGAMSRPVFSSEGPNTITLAVTVGEKTVQKAFRVTAVSPGAYAAVGSKAQCLADAHGCPACPHPTVGPITTGSPNVFVNGKPAARVGDKGIHAACCGPNTYEIVSGDPEVLINGRAAAKLRSATKHCGGDGQIISTG